MTEISTEKSNDHEPDDLGQSNALITCNFEEIDRCIRMLYLDSYLLHKLTIANSLFVSKSLEYRVIRNNIC